MAGGTGNSWSSLGWTPSYNSRRVRRPEGGSAPHDTTARHSASERRTQAGEHAGWEAEASRRRMVQQRAGVCCCSKHVSLSFGCLWGGPKTSFSTCRVLSRWSREATHRMTCGRRVAFLRQPLVSTRVLMGVGSLWLTRRTCAEAVRPP